MCFVRTRNPLHKPRLHLWETSTAESATGGLNVPIADFTCAFFFSTYLTVHQQIPPL